MHYILIGEFGGTKGTFLDSFNNSRMTLIGKTAGKAGFHSVRSKSLKYQRFTPSGCKDIGIRTLEFVTSVEFLYLNEDVVGTV